jgi:hypothetical protein
MKIPKQIQPIANLLKKHQRRIGLVGVFAFLIWFALYPSWPTPDRLFILLIFGFMTVGATVDGFKKFFPFVALILVYESFRGLADDLNTRVEYTWMIKADEFLFGSLPTKTLQDWFWKGSTSWYDVGIYVVYMMHFVLPFLLAFLIWRYKEKLYWHYALSILIVSFMGFITFAAFPAAPPWMAIRDGYVTDGSISVTSHIWDSIGFADIPSVYENFSPNPVAAVPSLHAAYATLLAIFAWKAFGRKWGIVASIYPFLIYVGTTYLGEHYFIDEIIGALYAVVAYYVAAYILKKIRARTKSRTRSSKA